ncbi:site-specific integrase [Kitasatospora cheerisanensis]|uniref:Phage integrase family protein n=1 Tax=Kitasatospora cheerisanensis KCTC 2395 TaxID=1348663 RepID=A0A066YXI9_9ACTN|nr:site-specific integrase [Kitasatospora cheerisanensis]KDN82806.1 phage integrase family protein [Kitasatospora cheerisanensis KCTC 2395]
MDRIGLRPGDPVFLRPDFQVDPDLLKFVLSPAFRGLERSTRGDYATDIRLLLDWLWDRGVAWWQASEADLTAYREWRCDSPLNPARIGGAKWNRETAALTKLFKWGKVHPLPVDSGRREDRAANARNRNVRWLTPRTWRHWINLGLRGYRTDGTLRPGWDGRTELRNTAFVQLGLSSGLRKQEISGLLTLELPTQRLRRGLYSHGTVPWALTRSKKSRVFYGRADALQQVTAYQETERAWAVRQAQLKGRYDSLPGIWLVNDVTRGLRPQVTWGDRDGTAGRAELARLDWRDRQRLFTEGPDGPEPLWLWLTEEGLPMLPDRWNTVFRLANLRCEKELLTAREQETPRHLRSAEARSRVPWAIPHGTRHSFALFMLIVLNDLVERKYGLTPDQRRDFANLFGDPWWLVAELLGHSDVETTKDHYLSPVRHMRLESILAFDEDDEVTAGAGDAESRVTGLFARLARETSGIQDLDALMDPHPMSAGRDAELTGDEEGQG